MSLEGLKLVGSERGSGPPPTGIGFEIFQMYVKKETDFKTYLEMNAVTVAKDAHKIRPQSFPAMPGVLRAYCQERIQQRRDYEVETGKRLGNWVKSIIYISEQNAADFSLLLWAKEKIEATGLKSELAAIESSLPEFERVRCPFDDLKLATETQEIDASAREQR